MFNKLFGIASASLLMFGAYGCDGNKEGIEYESNSAKTSEVSQAREEQAASGSTKTRRNERQVKAGYEEKKKEEDRGLSSDRRYHERYDRNYGDQFEAPH